jgi:hypothetical protein
LYFLARNVFGTARAPTRQIERHYASVGADYDAGAQMRLVTFLDNHDQPRFLHSSTTNRLAVALAFLYTARGVPCLYYGTEQAFNGGNDPYDREDMFAGPFKDPGLAGVDSFNMTHPLFQLVATLNNFRRLYPALTLGAHVNKWNNPSGPGLFAYSRRLGTQEVFVVFNTADTTQVLPGVRSIHTPGTPLVNLLDTNEIVTVTVTSQTPAISVPGTTAKIFIAQSQWLPLDPVVINNYPLHSAADVPAATPVVLQFSQAMDTNSVQSAFSLSPPAAGAFDWSAGHDAVTFTPAGAGLAGGADVVVRVSDVAFAAASGKHLHAAYELKFTTAAGSSLTNAPTAVTYQGSTTAR